MLFLGALFSLPSFAQTGKLTITVEGIESLKGNVIIGLYNKAKGFADNDAAIDGAEVKVTEKKVSYTFNDLQAGDYAVALFHDENSDGKLNTNVVGYPTEKYGFSNNKFGTFGSVPKFDKAKVKVGEGETKKIVIKLR